MAKSYRPWAPTQSLLLPPSPLEWLEEGHLAYFVLDVVTDSLERGRHLGGDPNERSGYNS